MCHWFESSRRYFNDPPQSSLRTLKRELQQERLRLAGFDSQALRIGVLLRAVIFAPLVIAAEYLVLWLYWFGGRPKWLAQLRRIVPPMCVVAPRNVICLEKIGYSVIFGSILFHRTLPRCIMSLLDHRSRSLSVAEANEMALRESDGYLGFVEEQGELFAVYRRHDRADDSNTAESEMAAADSVVAGHVAVGSATACIAGSAVDRRIAMSRVALTSWSVFEMARAAGRKPERMVHGRRAEQPLAPQLA